MNKFSTNEFHYNKETNCFSAEISELGELFEGPITLRNPATGNSKTFTFSHKDTDGESDIYGWNYKSSDGIKLLIIND